MASFDLSNYVNKFVPNDIIKSSKTDLTNFISKSLSQATSDSPLGLTRLPSSFTSGSDPTSVVGSTTGASSSSLSFPNNVTSSQYYMTFEFVEYTREKVESKASFNPIGSITLPIPSNLSEAFGIQYKQVHEGVVGAMINNMKFKEGDSFWDTISDITAAGTGFYKNSDIHEASLLGALRGSYVVDKFGSLLGSDAGITPIVQQELGSIINPHPSVLFGGINLRQFQFNWTLIPESKEESDTIKDIVKKFKFHSLPALSNGGTLILKYPHLVQPKLYPWESAGDYVFKFKKCLIPSVAISYSTGMNAFFKDTRAPSSVDIAIQLFETEYFTSDDFKDSNG